MRRLNWCQHSAPGDNPDRRVFDESARVLVVDDDETVRTYMRVALERAGLRVLEAVDGLAALAVWRDQAGAVVLVITDVRMPGMRGDELANRIKSESPAMPVILVSGEPGEGRFDDPANGIYYLEKPFRAEEIVDAAQRVLAHRR